MREQIYTLDTVDSTNLEALRRLRAGEKAPFAVTASSQSAGRGRLGRAFYSPAGGLYVSVALPVAGALSPLRYPAAAAVAVCRAMEAHTSARPRVKWVNDVLVDGKKACGILAEGFVWEGELRAVVVGAGINLDTGGFPEELRPVAGALPQGAPYEALRGALIAALLSLPALVQTDFLPEYRARSCVLGRRVRFGAHNAPETWREGMALDIDAQGALLVQTARGVERLATGEISLRVND